MTVCTSSPVVGITVFFAVKLPATFGLSLVGTNIFCHRYLVEKARVMIKMYERLAFFFRLAPVNCMYAMFVIMAFFLVLFWNTIT
jgi:hypothetical protein